MATFQERVESYTGTVGASTALAVWLNEGAKLILNRLPADRLQRYVVDITVSDTGTGISSYRITDVHKSGYPSREIPPSKEAMAVNSGSIFYAIGTSPVHIFKNAKLYIYADSTATTGTAIGIAYPTIAVSDSTITNFPAEYYQAVVLYASIQEIISRLRSAVSTLGSLTFTLPTSPTVLTAPSYSYTDATLGTYTATTIGSFGTAPTYTKPTSTADFTNSNTYIATEVDLEKASTEITKVRGILEQHQMDLYNELNEFNAQNAEYQGLIQKTIRQAELDQERLLRVADKTTDLSIINKAKALEAAISLYRDMLGRYQSEVTLYGQQVNLEITRFTAIIQQKSNEIEVLTKLLVLLKVEYEQALI